MQNHCFCVQNQCFRGIEAMEGQAEPVLLQTALPSVKNERTLKRKKGCAFGTHATPRGMYVHYKCLARVSLFLQYLLSFLQ